MPPSTTTTNSATPQMSRNAFQRAGQGVRSPAGPAVGSRQVIQATAAIKRPAHISPGKTWEGLFFGLLTAGAVGAICAPWIPHFVAMKGFIFGMIIGGIGLLLDRGFEFLTQKAKFE